MSLDNPLEHMSVAQFDALATRLEERLGSSLSHHVDKSMKKNFNSKIEKVSGQLSELRQEVQPVIRAYNTAWSMGTFVKWIAGILGSLLAIKMFFLR